MSDHRSPATQPIDIKFVGDDELSAGDKAALEAIDILIGAYNRPSAIFRPTLTVDGNMYCALYGEDLMQGCAGFGETAEAAMADFDKNWLTQKARRPFDKIARAHGIELDAVK